MLVEESVDAERPGGERECLTAKKPRKMFSNAARKGSHNVQTAVMVLDRIIIHAMLMSETSPSEICPDIVENTHQLAAYQLFKQPSFSRNGRILTIKPAFFDN